MHSITATADAIIEKDGKIVLIKRGIGPFKGRLGIPGGHVDENEFVEDAAVREAKEETGLDVEIIDLLGVYSDPMRDPRGRNICTVFITRPIRGTLKGGDDAEHAQWMDPNELKEHMMSFDHFKMIQDYLKWKKRGGGFWSKK